MKEDSKYYTPTIEEFRVGFEYEYDGLGKGNWLECVYEPTEYIDSDGTFTLPKTIKDGEIRVKLLDREDLKELGFKEEFIPDVYSEDDELRSGFSLNIIQNISINLHINTGNTGNIVSIYKQKIYDEVSGNWEVEYLFRGDIKNKSELQQILKMVL